MTDRSPKRRQATDRITYLGHATVLLELEGVRVLTDPVLRGHVGPLLRRQARPHAAQLAPLDAILISHLHLDHFDPPSLRRLPDETTVVTARGGARPLERIGFADVRELDEGEEIALAGLRVVATPALHEKGRHPLNRHTECVGFVVAREGRPGDDPIAAPRDPVADPVSIYYAGDTALFPEMDGLWPDLDAALLPIAGWGLTLPEGEHMGPRQAAEALRLLRPRLAVPVHWGTFALPGMNVTRRGRLAAASPPILFRRHARELVPGVRVEVLSPGQALTLERA